MGIRGKEEMDLLFFVKIGFRRVGFRMVGFRIVGFKRVVLGCGWFADDCNEGLVTRFLNPQKMALKDFQEFQAFDAKKIMQ